MTSARRKLSELRRARGLPNTVPIEIVRSRIANLHDLGMTNLMIGYAAGLGKSTVTHIMTRNEQYVEIGVAARIFGVDHRPHPNQLTVLALGAQRRVRALNAIGWTTEYQATRLGQRSRQVLNLAISKPTMTYDLWARIRNLYEELSGTPGPSANSIRIARNNGHVPPLAWEGRDIDHPHAQPDWAAAGIKIADRPFCRNGHPRTAENLIRDHRGHRACRVCVDERKQRAKRRKQAA